MVITCISYRMVKIHDLIFNNFRVENSGILIIWTRKLLLSLRILADLIALFLLHVCVKAVGVLLGCVYKLGCKSGTLSEIWNSSPRAKPGACSVLARSRVRRVVLLPQGRDFWLFPFPPAHCSGPWRPSSTAWLQTTVPHESCTGAACGNGGNRARGVASHCLLWLWQRALCTGNLLFMPLNFSPRKMLGTVALRCLVASSCVQHHLCQLRPCCTCCQLSSGWKAQIGADLASE